MKTSAKMFFLVKFHNDELYIARAAQVKILQENDCLVKYKGGSRYEATIIQSNDCKAELQKLKFEAESVSEQIIDLANNDDNNEEADRESEDKQWTNMKDSCNDEAKCKIIDKRAASPTEFETNKSEQIFHDDSFLQGAGCSTPVNVAQIPFLPDTSTFPILEITSGNNSTKMSSTTIESSLPPSDVSSLIHHVGDDWFKNSFGQDDKSRSTASDANDNWIGNTNYVETSIESLDTGFIHSETVDIREPQTDLTTNEKTDATSDGIPMNCRGIASEGENNFAITSQNVETSGDFVEQHVDMAKFVIHSIAIVLPENQSGLSTIEKIDPIDDDLSDEPNEPREPNEVDENFDSTNLMRDGDSKNQDDIPDSDPDYIPSNHTSVCKSDNSQNDTTKTDDESLCLPPIDIQELQVPYSRGARKTASKKDFCVFCKTLQTKLARHLELKHSDEQKVKNFIFLPKGLLLRKRRIDAIRREGNSLHNRDPKLNTGILITCRRKQISSRNTAEDYLICTKCQGYFSKSTIRIHYNKCNKQHRKGVREITVMGRRTTGYIHSRANNILRRVVFPVLNDDEVTRLIKFDELIILAGNKFCEKYTLPHQHDLIRSNLRLLGRFKLAVMKRDPSVRKFSAIFHPKYYDVAVEAIRDCAGYDRETQIFKSPSVASNLGTLLKKCANLWKTECIKQSRPEVRETTQQFLELYDMDFPTTINKKVIEDQIKHKRNKKIVLPSKFDIQKLHTFLKKNGNAAMSVLRKGFQFSAWKSLCEVSLILVQMFNRRRSGEIERLLINDYTNRESVDEHVNPDLYANLSEKSREYAKKYVRLTIRGKLGRTVPVLLDTTLVEWIDMILKFRSNAGVRSTNEFVFALPKCNKLAKKYIRACPLMRKFSEECGARMPSTLRGTTLRKHIATYTAMLNIEENQISDLANFMGHNKQIHKDIYRVPGPVKDVTDVSQLLQAAIGIEENDVDEDSDDDDDDPLEQPSNTQPSRKRRCDESGSAREDANCSKSSKKRSTSPYGKTKRIRWSADERLAVFEFFGDILKLDRLPSLQKCQEAIIQYPALHHRKPQQMKTWIDNQRKILKQT